MNYPKYEYTRTIRFSLDGESENILALPPTDENAEEVFEDFFCAFEDLLDAFQEAIFYKNDEGELRVKSRVEIKKQWLTQYAKAAFFTIFDDLSEQDRQRKSKFSAKLFADTFVQWLGENRNHLQQFRNILKKSQHEQVKRSDQALFLRTLKSVEVTGFIQKLIQPGIVRDKDSNECLENLVDAFGQFEDFLNRAFSFVVPHMNQGIETARASFNYYTINKTSKNFDDLIGEKKTELSSAYAGKVDMALLREIGFFGYLEVTGQTDAEYLPLERLYEALKRFKATKKSKFLEAVQQGGSLEELKRNYPLFEGKKEDTLQRFIGATHEERGKFFQYEFSKYTKLCNGDFKNLSATFGKLNAEIRALKQERIEARLLKYWAVLLEKDGRKCIMLIPKEKMGQVKRFLDELPVYEGEGHILYNFNSLTLRALEKLIRTNLGKEQTELSKNDISAIRLCQAVLRGEYREIALDFQGYENEIKEVANTRYDTKESFRMALERIAYYRMEKRLDEEQLEKLKREYGVINLRISSFDLERDLQGPVREHTQLWQQFWDSNNAAEHFSVRLNPEFRLFYRPMREQDDPKKKHNRFSRDHFGVAFTITQNAAQVRMETAFQKEKVLRDTVRKFNEEVVGGFVKEKAEDLWYYGIDRGQLELASLCVVRFSKEQYEAILKDGSVRKFDTPIPAPIKAYRIKDECLWGSSKEICIDRAGNKNKVVLCKNPSYHIDDESKFELVDSPCMDMTTAKLINGKIVLNGDLMTYIALKKASAKRRLFEVEAEADVSAQVGFHDRIHILVWDRKKKGRVLKEFQNVFAIKLKGDQHAHQVLCYYNVALESVCTNEIIRMELQEYLDALRSGNAVAVSIEKINHLRDAITSNMVGIIAFLFRTYPGIINLENLHSKEDIDRHFRQSNENIARRLEWSLYKKFQKTGLVPPRLRQAVLLREGEDVLNQLGIIHFVPTAKTSANCPYCGMPTPKSKRDEDKFKFHAYRCRENESHCGFDSRQPKSPLYFIRNSDDVAAYNIAKERIRMD